MSIFSAGLCLCLFMVLNLLSAGTMDMPIKHVSVSVGVCAGEYEKYGYKFSHCFLFYPRDQRG